ncbi:MAG: hypothetical protein ACR2H3_00390 [Acidimicrobiales bacterium]
MDTEPMTRREMVATAMLTLDRVDELAMIAARPGDLTNVKRVAFESMRRMVEQYPGVAWSPLWDG